MPSAAESRGAVPRTIPLLARWFTPILLANVVAQVGIIVTGGLVRVTASGLGCPTWPQCVPGSFTPVQHQEEGIHRIIEFGNRLLTYVLFAVAVAAVVAVWKHRPRRHLKVAALLVLLGIPLQALIGGVVVLLHLHPVWVSLHFLVSVAMSAIAMYLYATRDEAEGPAVPTVPVLLRRLAVLTCAVAGVVLVLGTVVTGAGPHSGDDTRPSRLALDPRSVSWLHADAVMLFVGLAVAVAIAVRLVDSGQRARRGWAVVLGVTLAQAVLGYVQYALAIPRPLVVLHMLLAALLAVALTEAMVGLRRRQVGGD
jgi:cytochrome c oxidase assembly protein subunit 15